MNHRKKGYLFVLLSALCFATGGLLIKINSWSSMTINGVRSLFALLIFYPYFRSIGHKFCINKMIIIGALANTGMCFSFVAATKLTTAANAIVLQFTLPIYIILMLWIFWKKRPDRVSVLTALFSFIGILFFFFDNLTTSGMVGNLLALLSGFLYAIVFLIKKIPNADFESSAVLSFALNFIIAIPFYVQETSFTTTNVISALLLGLVQTGLAFVFLAKGLDHVPPVAASLISMVEPIVNPILVAAFYGETIGLISIFGAIVVLGSATFYSIYSSK
ncbi:MAG: DMT family transporter [Agathobacter sp.]